jgi:hypothetical protein
MIEKVNFSCERQTLSVIPSIVRGKIGVYPIFDQSFIYVLRHTLVGKHFTEAGTRSAALKALRDLDALHSWETNSDGTIKDFLPDAIEKARSIRREALDSFPEDDEVDPSFIIQDAVDRRLRRGKFVPESLLQKINKKFEPNKEVIAGY